MLSLKKTKDGARMSLDKLAIKIAKRDEKAFERLYEDLRRVVFAVCLGVVKNRGIAEELTQETFVTVWQKTADFAGWDTKLGF